MSSIGNNIKLLRKNQGLTQEQVATATGISRELLSYFECGARAVPVKYLDLFADLFNVDIEQLLEENPSEMQMFTSFRSLESTDEDLIQIASFRRIVKNYIKLKALSNEQKRDSD
jgi:transcriptional regulator with XRE-family HTH domain